MQKRGVATVIVAGPAGAHLFGRPDESATQDLLQKRWGGSAAWVLAAEPEDLVRMLREASHDGAPCAVVLPLVPTGGDDMAMRREWREWRKAIARCSVQGNAPVPAYLAVYACLGPAGEHPVKLRSRISTGNHPESRINLRHAMQTLRMSAARRLPGPDMLRERLALSVLDWSAEAALLASMEEIASTPPLFLGGVFLVDAGTTLPNMSAWLRWLAARTGLNPMLPRPVGGALPLPPLSFDAKRPHAAWTERAAEKPRTPRWRGAGVAASVLTLVLATVFLLGVPYLRVKQDIDRFTEDLRVYESVPQDRMFDKCAALIQVRNDHDDLGTRLGQGGPKSWLHHQAGGESTWKSLSEAISAYRPPQTALRLDSMAVFESGNASLVRATAIRLLEPVAQLLRANPDLLVQVVGHTDATGTAEQNDALSLARAQAVRDELIAMSGAQPGRFYVVGRGSAQPSEDNATAAGRALNRRVEITLTAPPSSGFACGAFTPDAVPAE
ncbi:OmpA family protein [Achromobacter seleniivolatilans]|uniref:OmpA family protein n=1 Tax=Achromobacter seleniivolatilans TaxID=3047478 RepID=A0ABY9LZS1_9BURK|nr:OmpA family protein [Achromobacter sp. R39]WMD20242.1 OmpA family protein [Achromobacter sp. R39]